MPVYHLRKAGLGLKSLPKVWSTQIYRYCSHFLQLFIIIFITLSLVSCHYHLLTEQVESWDAAGSLNDFSYYEVQWYGYVFGDARNILQDVKIIFV